MRCPDPIEGAPELIPRVYAYVAYRIGNGPHAEDVTSETFERALRYRSGYDSKRGPPLPWLLGIARRVLADRAAVPAMSTDLELVPLAVAGDLAEDSARRVTVRQAVSRLPERDRELVALRYGADLTAREIGRLLGMRTNAVEVALHRALSRLRADLAPSFEAGVRVQALRR
jgi:RNA polymerase sigma-70 factor (ECF subfamily)